MARSEVDDLVCREARQGDGPALLRLYRACFRRHGASDQQGMAQLRGRTQVALLGERIVGLGIMERIGDDGAHRLRSTLSALEPTARALLEPLGELEGAAIRIEAPPDLHVTAGQEDVRFTALAVHPDSRRRGVGTALVRARLALAIADGAPQVFVHCVAGSGSRSLYERMGFTPLVTKRHHYRGGAGVTLLHAFL